MFVSGANLPEFGNAFLPGLLSVRDISGVLINRRHLAISCLPSRVSYDLS